MTPIVVREQFFIYDATHHNIPYNILATHHITSKNKN